MMWVRPVVGAAAALKAAKTLLFVTEALKPIVVVVAVWMVETIWYSTASRVLVEFAGMVKLVAGV